jgi:hypothetical protein
VPLEVGSVLTTGPWVPHISLVFREMWDSTSLDRPPSRTKQTPMSEYFLLFTLAGDRSQNNAAVLLRIHFSPHLRDRSLG